MEDVQETVELDMEELNELFFKVKVEGAEPAPAKVRLVCEVGDLAYMFNGKVTGEQDVVQFVVPAMKNKLKEGTYASRVEVLVENRYFAPVKFNINFKKVVSVVAEAVSVPTVRKVQPAVTVTASPIIVKKPVAEVATAPRPTPAVKKVETPKPKSQVPSLRDRYASKLRESVIDLDESDEYIIKEIAQELARSARKR